MANILNATSTGNGGLISTGDDSGVLNIQTNETTALSIDASQNVTFTNAANLPNTFGMKNRLINGDFNIWQRETSFAAIASGAYSADRWVYLKTASAVHTVSRSTDVPTVAQSGRLYNYSTLIDCTTADTSVAAGDYVIFSQYVEGYNFLPLAQKTFTVSFWVKATKTGTYCVSFSNTGADRSYVAEYTVSASDTWEYKTVTVSASPSAGTWDYTTGIGLRVWFVLMSGSTYQTTAGSWATGNYQSTSNQVNACDNTANNFYITGVQLELGSAATSFDSRPFGTELALCQRYYQKTYAQGTNPGTNTTTNLHQVQNVASGPGNQICGAQFLVTMRASASVVIYAGDGTQGSFSDASFNTQSTGTNTIADPGDSRFRSIVLGSGSAGSNQFTYHWTASAEL